MTGQTTRQGIRTVVQRLAGAAVLVIGLGGFWYWWAHPLPGGAAMRQAVLAGQAFCLPVGLGQMVFCPSRRDPGEGELEVAGKTYPLKKGQHFIIPHPVADWTFRGDLMLITSFPTPGKY